MSESTHEQDHRNMTNIAWVIGVLFCALTVASSATSSVWAQGIAVTPTPLLADSSSKPPVATSSAKNSGDVSIPTKPSWQELTPTQQTSLKPLAEKWATLGEAQKRKWIAIATNYPNLSVAEQEKLHSRMSDWVALSQQQRAQARLNFAQSKTLTPNQKTATWEAYQALSPEEKQKLAASASTKPVGAAATVKPVPHHKLATIPASKSSAPKQAGEAPGIHAINKNTLLPHVKPTSEPASASAPEQKN